MKARFYFSGNEIHDRCMKSMMDGCPYETQAARITEYKPADVAVMFGTYKKKIPVSWPRGEVLRKQKEEGLETIVLDSGYIHRGDGAEDYYAIGS